MIQYRMGYKALNKDCLIELFSACDNDFSPSLSKTMGIEKYASKIYSYSNMIIAEDIVKHKIVGFCFFYDNNIEVKEAFLSLIHVNRDYRNRGISKALLSKMFKRLIDVRFQSISLEVNTYNSLAINLYQSYGFKIVGRKNNSIFMKLEELDKNLVL
jgi:ribosomal protein S18 acetylase RimI-like enzyme